MSAQCHCGGTTLLRLDWLAQTTAIDLAAAR